jgi:hypothetical protein
MCLESCSEPWLKPLVRMETWEEARVSCISFSSRSVARTMYKIFAVSNSVPTLCFYSCDNLAFMGRRAVPGLVWPFPQNFTGLFLCPEALLGKPVGAVLIMLPEAGPESPCK